MKKGSKSSVGYYIFNSIIVIILIALVDFVIFGINTIINIASVEVDLQQNTEEQILEKYNDNENFKKYYNTISDNIAKYQEKLNTYEYGTDEYTNIENTINYYQKYLIRNSLFSTYILESQKDSKLEVITCDALIVIIYIAGMLIFVKVKKKKDEKLSTKKVTNKNMTKKNKK